MTAARQQLPTIKQWSDYDEICLRLLREAVTQLKAEQATVQADDATQKLSHRRGCGETVGN